MGGIAGLSSPAIGGSGTMSPAVRPWLGLVMGPVEARPSSICVQCGMVAPASGEGADRAVASRAARAGTSTANGASSSTAPGSSGRELRVFWDRFDVPSPDETRLVPNEVILDVVSTVSRSALDHIAARNDMTRLEVNTVRLTGRTLHRWRINGNRSVRDTIIRLAYERVIAGAAPNYVYELSQHSSAPSYVAEKLDLPEAHRIATGGRVSVALIDSGVDASHPALAGAVVDGFNALPDNEPQPHGTAMAGGIVNVAPDVKIIPVRVFGAGVKATTFNIIKGIDWAAKRGARIVNMSFTGPPDRRLRQMLLAASEDGIVLVAAAGNAGPNAPPSFPGAEPNVIAVTATDENDQVFGEANRGPYIAVAAPGVDILVPAPDAAYEITTGTSIAAAEASGLAALLIARAPKLSPAAVRKIMMDTARDLGPAGYDPVFGAGLLNALGAVESIKGRAVVAERR
jgi:subtilisin family serine protease